MGSKSSAKSKRSLKSVSSEPSSSQSDGKESNKKNKTSQRTLGMAWGANSQSASRAAFRNSPFPDFGSYMALKNQKLREQFDAAASSSSCSGSVCVMPIFDGVSIFVDGYTVPSSQELKGYMLKYGGRFENYFSRQRVTHIICSNLPDSKIKNLRAFSGGLPVVKPEWVVESVACSKLLSWAPYQLDKLVNESDNQRKLSVFFTRELDISSKTGNSLSPVKVMLGDQSLAKEISHPVEDSESLRQADISSGVVGDLMTVNMTEVKPIDSVCSVEGSCEQIPVERNDSPLDEKSFDEKYKSVASPTHSLAWNDHQDDCCFHEASSSKAITPSSRLSSTFSDPNFVENYFKSSRLHFIGTWKNRYRKRFPGSGVTKGSCLDMAPLKEKATIIHIDMDCFFVSVVIRNKPELTGKPVAVCHSDSPRGTAEISSANYAARDYGVKAGMFVRDAKIRCPHLVIVPYDFGAYEKVADQFYDILHKHCTKVQAISCDEAFLDISESEMTDPQLVASIIRAEISETTGCTASAGIAGNMLMARLATRSAKPDGQCYIPTEKVDAYLCSLPVEALPGIGHALEGKLDKKKIKTCGQLRLISKESLQRDFGKRTGEMLWNYSRGIDNRMVGLIQENKSVGADVNWGVRFRNTDEVFLRSLCKEVALRLHGCGLIGRSFTLKVKKRSRGAGEPVKYMGCGVCENLSHTITIPMPTDDVDTLLRLTTQLFGYFQLDPQDIRGVGLHVSKLEGGEHGKAAHKKNSIRPWLFPMPARPTDPSQDNAIPNNANSLPANTSFGSESTAAQPSDLPPLEDLDLAIIESLPQDILSEINTVYGGKLSEMISKNVNQSGGTILNVSPTNDRVNVEGADCHACIAGTDVARGNMNNEEPPATPARVVLASPKLAMPLSMSQVDPSVLHELPDEFQKGIIEFLPPHRDPGLIGSHPPEAIEEITAFTSLGINDLWLGSPPKWIEKFEVSKCTILNSFSRIYKSGCGGCLSSLLEHILYGNQSLDSTSDESSDSFSLVCELFKQYADLKIATDIEEIYSFACVLRRLQARSKFFSEVHNSVLPHMQALVAKKYGGTLHVPC